MLSTKYFIIKGVIALGIVLAYFIALSKFIPSYSPNLWLKILIWPYIKVWGEMAFGNGYIGLVFLLLYCFIVFVLLLGIEYLIKRITKKE